MSVKKKGHLFCHLSFWIGQFGTSFFYFLREGFRCVTLLAVLEVVLVDQVDLELRDPPASVSQVLGLKACASTTQPMKTAFNSA